MDCVLGLWSLLEICTVPWPALLRTSLSPQHRDRYSTLCTNWKKATLCPYFCSKKVNLSLPYLRRLFSFNVRAKYTWIMI